MFVKFSVYGFSRLTAMKGNLWAIGIKAEVSSQMAFGGGLA